MVEVVAELRVIAPEFSLVNRMARNEGLLKGRVSWTPEAFAPLTDAELAEFDGASVFPR